MLDRHGDLAIAELIFYVPVLPIAILVAHKHGFARTSGWFFIVMLAVIRIVGTVMTIVVETEQNPSGTLVAVAATLVTLGLSPLTLCTIGIVNRLHNELPRKPLPGKVFLLLGLLPVVALILSIVGGVNLGEAASDPSSSSGSGTNYLAISSILYIAVIALLALVAIVIGTQIRQIPGSERKLFYAVVLSLPFLLVRTIYSVLSAFNYTNYSSPFNSHTGSIFIQAFMATLEEFIVVLLYLTAGWLTPKHATAAPAATKFQSADSEPGYGHQASTYPMQAPYPGQQIGRV